MQKLTIIGNIGRDADLKEINSQFLVQFSVAVNNGYYNQQGNWVDRTNWYNCKIWKEKSKTDIVKKLLKGRKIYIEGSPDISTYKGSDNQTKIDLSIRVTSHEFLDTLKKEGEQQSPVDQVEVSKSSVNTTITNQIDDDLPF